MNLTPWFRAFMLTIGVLAIATLCNVTFADEPIHLNLDSVSKATDKTPPKLSVGVIQCGEAIAIWVIMQDNRVVRTDAMHHPETVEQYNAFLKWLDSGPQDIFTIPCKKDPQIKPIP